MCTDLKPISQTEAIVYKVVAQKKKGKRYYSIAMGFMYPQKGKVPKPQVQRGLGYFVTSLLNKLFFIRDMVGRTAGFLNRNYAESFMRRMKSQMQRHGELKKYSLLTVKIKLTDGLMSGFYESQSVIAGRHIEFLE